MGILTIFLAAACGGGSDAETQPAPANTASTVAQQPTSTDAPAPTPQPATRAPDAAPDFELVLFETENHARGEKFRLAQWEGKPVVVNFWFPSCPPCVAEMPDLEAAFQSHKADGVEFVGVQLLGLDTAEDGQKFVDEMGVTYAVGPDETGDIVVKHFKVTGFPNTVFLDREHRVVRKWSGILDADKIEALVQELLD